jgi:cob(I)alamin adenosyltransferase
MDSGERVPKIYTRTGDKGKTSLIGGTRVAKSHLRLEAYGTVDELNSHLGVILVQARLDLAAGPASSSSALTDIQASLMRIQNELFNIGSQLACEEPELRAKLPNIDEERITELERLMDQYTAGLKPLRNFILPGGSRAAAETHVARTVCRRAERICVALAEETEIDPLLIRYVNRLSDYLFVLARHFNALTGIDEPIWGQ